VYSEINDSLAVISKKLFRTSLNYCVDFKFFVSKETVGKPLETVVRTILGEHAEIGMAQPATKKDVIDELTNALQYRGDHGSHPSLDYLDSNDCRIDFEQITCRIQRVLDDSSDDIQSFWLKEGHPFYPVFWDFAFLIRTCGESILFIGSSSD
jgi:hypothetical protein